MVNKYAPDSHSKGPSQQRHGQFTSSRVGGFKAHDPLKDVEISVEYERCKAQLSAMFLRQKMTEPDSEDTKFFSGLFKTKMVHTTNQKTVAVNEVPSGQELKEWDGLADVQRDYVRGKLSEYVNESSRLLGGTEPVMAAITDAIGLMLTIASELARSRAAMEKARETAEALSANTWAAFTNGKENSIGLEQNAKTLAGLREELDAMRDELKDFAPSISALEKAAKAGATGISRDDISRMLEEAIDGLKGELLEELGENRTAQPASPAVLIDVSGFEKRQASFEKELAALKRRTMNPEAQKTDELPEKISALETEVSRLRELIVKVAGSKPSTSTASNSVQILDAVRKLTADVAMLNTRLNALELKGTTRVVVPPVNAANPGLRIGNPASESLPPQNTSASRHPTPQPEPQATTYVATDTLGREIAIKLFPPAPGKNLRSVKKRLKGLMRASSLLKPGDLSHVLKLEFPDEEMTPNFVEYLLAQSEFGEFRH